LKYILRIELQQRIQGIKKKRCAFSPPQAAWVL
jgi:hypothetical protein